MPFPLYGSPGNLFNVLGAMGNVVTNVNSFQTTLKPSLIDTTTGVTAQLANEPDLAAVIGSSWISLLASLETPAQTVQQLASSVINRLVFNYQPQLNQTLTNVNLDASINFTIQQMLSQAATVLQMTVSAVPQPFVGIGNGIVNVSLKRPFDGKYLENAFQEELLFTCTADSYIGGATAYNEQFSVTGEGQESDVFAFDWPLGSNGTISINAIDGDTNQGSGNLLNNSGFASWTITANVPDNWTLVVGTAGTNVLQNSTIVFTTGSSMQWVGDGSTLINLTQTFNSGTGNSSTLSPQTQYSVNLYLRTGGIAPSQGILQVDLIDQNNNIINDCAGNPNSFTIDLTTLGVGWAGFSGFFRTPENVPTTQSIRYHLTTALNSGAVVYFDKTSMGLANQVYLQGPFVAIHSGNVPFVQSPIADYAYCQINNSRGAGGTLVTWQTLLYRMFGSTLGYELIWPSSLTPTISDALIT